MKRVVITGFGTINPVGKDSMTSWENFKKGTNGLSKASEDILEKTNVKVTGQIHDFDPELYFDKKMIRSLDRTSLLALVSAREAYKMANLDQVEDRFKIGTNVTSGIGGITTIEEQLIVSQTRGYNRVTSLFIPKAIINLISGNIAIDLNLKGINNAIVTACASSTDAIGHAYSYIKSGMVDVMLTGGTECATSPIGMAGFDNMRALSRNEDINAASIPFDENRNGFVMGEGACTLVLEDYDHAIKRGATIYGEIVGYGVSCDASHITAPDENATGSSYAVEMALKCANIKKEDINYINAHGTSTPLNDKSEIMMIRKVFKDHAKNIHVTSSKSMTGHLLGAAGAMEGFISLMSLLEGVVTPTINIKNIDPDCEGVKIAQTLVKDDKMKYAMSTSLGFGGHNSVIIFKKY